MGEVWRASDLDLGRQVALKVLLEFHEADDALARFRREAAIGAQFQHPGITVVHDIGQHDNRLFIVMELLDGQDLARVLAGAPHGLSIAEAVGLAEQAARALSVTHARGVVHRDLKPANLFRLTDGRLKICDFGIARVLQATQSATRTGWMLGTPAYMAPEQWRGKDVGTRADIYALGCVLYELLTGSPPFRPGEEPLAVMQQHLAETPAPLRTVRAEISDELESVVSMLLAKDPDARPDADSAAERLRRIHAAASDPRIVRTQRAQRSPLVPELELESEPETVSESAPESAVPPMSTSAPTVTADHGPAPAVAATVTVAEASDASAPVTSEPRPRRRAVLFGGVGVLAAFSGATAIQLLTVNPSRHSNNDSRRPPAGNPSSAAHPATARSQPRLAYAMTAATSLITSVAFSPDGKTLATGGDPVQLWDLASRTAATLQAGTVLSVAFSPDGKTLACGYELWDVASRQKGVVLAGTSEADPAALSVAFSPDRRTVATAGGDGSVRLWDVIALSRIAVLPDPATQVNGLAFSPDGKTLAGAGNNGTIQLWDVGSGTSLATMTAPMGAVFSVAFCPDGKTLATGSKDETVRLWNVSARTNTATLTGHTDQVSSVAFSPDGKTLVSGANDHNVRLWDVATGAGVATLTGATDAVFSVAFSPDGKTVASGGRDSRVLAWQL